MWLSPKRIRIIRACLAELNETLNESHAKQRKENHENKIQKTIFRQ